MRRMTDTDVIKQYALIFIASIGFIVSGILVAILPHIMPYVPYDSLQTKEVTITVFDYSYGGRHSSGHYYIRTTEGEMFNITGAYTPSELCEVLTSGTEATIKWHKNKPFWTLLVEEMYVDGTRVVTYDNDKPADWKLPLIIGIFCLAIGIGGLFLIRFFLKDNRRKQELKDKRIQRKYGTSRK